MGDSLCHGGARFFWSEIVFVPGGVALAGIWRIWRILENLKDLQNLKISKDLEECIWGLLDSTKTKTLSI